LVHIPLLQLSEQHRTLEDEELERKKARLAELEGQLANRELELASLLADLMHFEKSYLHSVGRRYATLDELKAKIAEARVRINPASQDAREDARQARSRARESAQAAGEVNAEAPIPNDAAPAALPNRSATLNRLFREAAWLLHPDRTLRTRRCTATTERATAPRR
jgi:hypothetical protein